MTDFSFHLAPNAPWILLLALGVVAALLAAWAYRFAVPPLPALARRALPLMRALALVLLLALLAQPVLERARGGQPGVVVLVDRSRSMDLPVAPGGPTRKEAAARAVERLRAAWRGRGRVAVAGFAERFESDSGSVGSPSATALGDAIDALSRSPLAERAGAVVVVSDGVVNAGADPVAAGRALGLPVHAVVVGSTSGADRAIAGIEASASARVGEATPVRVRLSSTEPAGTPLHVTLTDGARVLARADVVVPPGGAEAVAEMRVTPDRPGLATWTARVDSLRGEVTTANDARQVAVEVAPGRLGVLVVSGGLNWDLAFVRRALLPDSGLALITWIKARQGWSPLERASRSAAPGAEDLRGKAVVVLDGVAPNAVSPEFDRALAAFVRAGGGLLVLGGATPGVTRLRSGALGSDLAFELDAAAAGKPALPQVAAESRELLMWDDDPARSAEAWKNAAPLRDAAPLAAGAGDRVLIASAQGGPPLMLARRVGRGQALLVNGSGVWRWSLNAEDDFSGERGRRLWRRIVRWLAEPVQGEPLRVRPERWLVGAGETVRLVASLQDDRFQPVAGAEIAGEARPAAGGAARPLRFEAKGAGTYEVRLEDLPPGRWMVRARATRSGRELGATATEFAVDRWSLESARAFPDSAALAALAAATGGSVTPAADAERWARGVGLRALRNPGRDSTRLWESPWLFAFVVGALSIEWIWRRRRGLP